MNLATLIVLFKNSSSSIPTLISNRFHVHLIIIIIYYLINLKKLKYVSLIIAWWKALKSLKFIPIYWVASFG